MLLWFLFLLPCSWNLKIVIENDFTIPLQPNTFKLENAQATTISKFIEAGDSGILIFNEFIDNIPDYGSDCNILFHIKIGKTLK